jgi:hypothetical protein
MTRFTRAASGLLVLAILVLGVSDGRARAQSASAPPQRQLLLINEVNLKPDTAPEWSELQKTETIPAQKKGGLPWRDTWASGLGGDPYLRATVTPISSLGQFDGESPMLKALGQQGAAALGAKNRRLVAGSRSRIVTTRPDLGFGTRPAAPKIGVLSIVTVTNGRVAEFEAFLKSDVIPALKKGGAGYYSVVQNLFGGDANEFSTLVLFENYAELGKGHPLERALGADGMARLAQKSASFVSRLERRIIRYLPDLSYRPAAATSN